MSWRAVTATSLRLWGTELYPGEMPTVAIIPVKSFRAGKQRLADALPEDVRSALGRAMAGHVAETAAQAGLMPLMVTPDPEVAVWATDLGWPSLPDPGTGLDAAAKAGLVWASESRSNWVVVHADLPLLAGEELMGLNECFDAGEDPIAPSADGGTSVLGSRSPIRFSFGPGSFQRHLAQLHRPRVLASMGLLHDLDSPGDLDSTLTHPRGRWLADLM